MNFMSGKSHSFANLIGLGKKPAAKKADGDEEMNNNDGEDASAEEDDADAGADEDGKKGKKKSKKSKKNKNAPGDEADDENDDDGEGDQDDDNEDQDHDDDDNEDDGEAKRVKKAEARGRRRERARVAQILGTDAAAANIALAAELACNTNLSPERAEAVLKKGGSASRGLRDRMAGARPISIGSGDGGEPKGQSAINASWDRAAKQFMPKKKD